MKTKLQDALIGHNYPRSGKYVAIDFETFWDDDCTCSRMSTIEYVCHDKFAVHIVSVFGEGISYVGPIDGFNWHHVINSYEFVSHNAIFDAYCYMKAICHDKTYCSNKIFIMPIDWHCTARLAEHLGSPRSLKKAAKHILGIDLCKDLREESKGMTTEQIMNWDKYDEFAEYCLNDAKTSLAIWDKYKGVLTDPKSTSITHLL